MSKSYTSEAREIYGSDGVGSVPSGYGLKKPRNQLHVPILLVKSSGRGKKEVDLLLTQSSSTVTEGKELWVERGSTNRN